MNLTEISEKIDEIGNAWEHFKSINDEKLRQIEQKGSADCMVMEELNKINNSLNEQKQQLDQLRISASRPSFEGKNMDFQENLEHKKALNNSLIVFDFLISILSYSGTDAKK